MSGRRMSDRQFGVPAEPIISNSRVTFHPPAAVRSAVRRTTEIIIKTMMRKKSTAQQQ